jgi:putative addiction module component (TIGR02574 family)
MIRKKAPYGDMIIVTWPVRSGCENYFVAATVDRLAQDALTLSDRERAELAHKLLVSLDGIPDEGAEEAWDQEIANRVQKIREGTAKGRPADEVFRDIRSRYKWSLSLSRRRRN